MNNSTRIRCQLSWTKDRFQGARSIGNHGPPKRVGTGAWMNGKARLSVISAFTSCAIEGLKRYRVSLEALGDY